LQKWRGVVDGFRPSDFPIMVGADPQPGGIRFPFAGRIKEVRCSTGVLYTDNFKPSRRLASDRNTLLLLHFDEGEGGVAYDCSGNNRHGMIRNAEWVAGNK